MLQKNLRRSAPAVSKRRDMKAIHTPRIDARYWTAITLASVFGTNLGDFYAHESGLGIVKGLAVLALLTAIAFVAEHFDKLRHQAWYWIVIIIIRTGATNIADYLAFRVRIPGLILTLSLAILIALFAFGTHRAAKAAGPNALPPTNAPYWLAMLSAGVFGTVLGDICEHAFGEGIAAIGLTILLLIVLAAGFRRAAQQIAIYWLIVAVARTAGTAIGDWFAENEILHIGLPLCTLGSGIAFVGILLFWRSSQKETAPALA
jgi:uncharacterized membrane-anchored protein